ncbi:MAG: hypothetical protein HDR21_10615 [Lachnospiraceae bacterium]|nr:hypothetical protein [Lachnospiraceae bacterium]
MKKGIVQKMIKLVLSSIVGIGLLLSACGKKDNNGVYEIPTYTENEWKNKQNEEGELLFESYEDEYIINKWTEEQTGIESPYGICVLEDAIYVCDFFGHCVVKLGLDGERIASYGQLGAESGNFTNPTAIVCHESLIYVLDQGNHRIQIFDQEMNYQYEVSYMSPVFSKTVYFQDMAVDREGTIYLSEWEGFVDDAAIYYIAEDGIATQIEPHISGVLAEYQGGVYAINTYSLFYVQTATGLARGATFGESFLFDCTKVGLEQIGELPYKYAAADFCVVDDIVYAVSLYNPLRVQMNRLFMDGELDSAIYIFERGERDYSTISQEPVEYPWYLDVVDDNHIYAVDSLWKTIYYLQKAE